MAVYVVAIHEQSCPDTIPAFARWTELCYEEPHLKEKVYLYHRVVFLRKELVGTSCL